MRTSSERSAFGRENLESILRSFSLKLPTGFVHLENA